MRLDSVHHHKYQKSKAGSVTVLTAVPSRQSFLPRGQAPWGIIFWGQFFSGGQSFDPRGQAPWRFDPFVEIRLLHGPCARGLHD